MTSKADSLKMIPCKEDKPIELDRSGNLIWKIVPFARFIVVGIVIVLMCGSCRSKQEPPKGEAAFENDDYPVQETWNSVISFSDSGYVRAVLKAAYIAQYPRNGLLEKRVDGGLEVSFLSGGGEVTSILKSKKGIVYTENAMMAYDSVVVQSNDDTTIITDSLRWDAKDKMIRSTCYVRIEKPGEVISGYGFESDQALKEYRIFNASGQTKMAPPKPSSKEKVE